MSSETLEGIDSYVDLQTIRANLAAALLSESESEAAAQTIQLGRAQFVVDAVADELDRRSVQVTKKRDRLMSSLRQLDEQQAIIDTALGRRRRIYHLMPTTYERLSLIKDASTTSKFMRIMENEPPFTLWLQDNQGVDGFNYDYARSHTEQLEPTGTSKQMVSSSFGALYRVQAFNPPKEDDELQSFGEHWGFGEIARDDNGSVVSIEVNNPSVFFDSALSAASFGLGSAKAVMTVAYLQRQQLIESQEQK